jgi:hypothetical protein
VYGNEGERKHDHAVNPDNAVFDHERAKFLVPDFEVPFRTNVGVHPASGRLSIDATERTRVSANRINCTGLIGRGWRQFVQIGP